MENFLRHVASSSYDNNNILRYIPNFILQSGDKSNSGKVSDAADPHTPFVRLTPDNAFRRQGSSEPQFKRGTVAMVKNDQNNEHVGSQFFIVLSNEYAEVLKNEGKYIPIGNIIDGFEALDKIGTDRDLNDSKNLKKNGKPKGKWKTVPWIHRIVIHNNPFA